MNSRLPGKPICILIIQDSTSASSPTAMAVQPY